MTPNPTPMSARPPKAFDLHPMGFLIEMTLSGTQIIHVKLDTLSPAACNLAADRRYALRHARLDLYVLAQYRIDDFKRALVRFEMFHDLVRPC